MFHLHLIGVLTLEMLALTAAAFLFMYASKQADKWFRHLSKVLVVIMHIIIVATVTHAIIHHFSNGAGNDTHQKMIEQQVGSH